MCEFCSIRETLAIYLSISSARHWKNCESVIFDSEVDAKLIRWCETEVICRETEVICQKTEVKHYEIESKSLSILNRENDVGNVKISLMEMKLFVLPAKKGIERLVGEKKVKPVV